MGCFGSASSKADQEETKKGKETNKKINQQLQKDKQVYRATHRLLLLGKSQNPVALPMICVLSVSHIESVGSTSVYLLYLFYSYFVTN